MSYEFKKLSEVESLPEVPDGAKVASHRGSGKPLAGCRRRRPEFVLFPRRKTLSGIPAF